jgi:hypothetical protein
VDFEGPDASPVKFGWLKIGKVRFRAFFENSPFFAIFSTHLPEANCYSRNTQISHSTRNATKLNLVV